MATEYNERCLTCKWLAPNLTPPCGRTFEALIHISPHGGKVNITTTPGLIPVEFEDRLKYMLERVFASVVNTMELWPGWRELEEIQANSPGKKECPGRIPTKNEFLKLVKT